MGIARTHTLIAMVTQQHAQATVSPINHIPTATATPQQPVAMAIAPPLILTATGTPLLTLTPE